MKGRNIHIVLATTLFSTLLWFSLSMSEHYQIQVSAPLVIESLPPGRAISSPLPREVKLTFNDYGWRLAKFAWKPGIEWAIDLNALPQRTLTLRDFAQQLSERLGVQPISMNPESLHITLDAVASKRVRVTPRYAITFREGYGQVGKASVQPESVIVTGAQNLLERIDSWPTMIQSFEQLRQSITVDVLLADSLPSLVFDPSKVTLQITVQQIAEKIFPDIPIELVSVPQNREIILSTSKIELVVRGGIEQLTSLSERSFRASVDYRTILEDTSGTVQPEITSPKEIQIVKRTPERLHYVVRKKP